MRRVVALFKKSHRCNFFSSLGDASLFSGFNEQNFNNRPIEELFPVIASLIESQEYSRMEQVVNFCRHKRPQDWFRALNSPSMPNMIFKSALDSIHKIPQSELKDQFSIFRKDLNINVQRPKSHSVPLVKPDTMSYALMFKYIMILSANENMSDSSIKSDLKYLESEASLFDIQITSIIDVLEHAEILEPDQLKKLKNFLEVESFKNAENVSDEAFNLKKSNIGSFVEPEPSRVIDLPEVRTISSKSEGINFIKDSLKQLFELDPESLKDSNIMYNLQYKLEQDCYSAMISKLRKESEALSQVTGVGNVGNIKKELVQWLDTLKIALENEFNGGLSSIDLGKGKDTGYYLALLSALDAEKISIIVIQELLKISLYEPYFLTAGNDLSTSTPIPIKAARLVTLSTNIGSALQREVFAVQISKKPFLNRSQLKPLQLAQLFDKKRTLDKSMRRVYAQLEGDLEAQREGWIPAWTNGLKAEIGSFLLALVEKTLLHRSEDGKIEPVFKHCVIYSGNLRKLGVIRIIDEIFEKLKAEKHIAFVEAWAMPMLVPPKPWLTITSGGYLTHKNTCVRLKDDPVQLSLLAGSQKDGQLESVLMGLDVLGRVPWRINEKILRISIELWNQGVNVSELSATNLNLLENSKYPFMKREDFEKIEEYREYCRQAVNSRNEANRQHSMTCDTNYKLEIARTFAGIPFYLPHSVDFRGRAYPIPPHLSHIGSDLSRGLLEFAEGRPLGEEGLFWLKVQFSNMCGNDKCSLKDRAAFADRHMKEIQESARDPFAIGAFWRTADEPWQCLATCIEISSALELEDPSKYVSHLPVQQDGSCNGSQHYAALGGDVEGAEQVNLSPSPVPQDIYGTVAKIVSREIDRDVEKFSKSSVVENDGLDEKVAKLLQGRITRKIVKQPVMTNIYGVTLYGAKKQIEARLKEFALIPVEDEQLMRKAREYLTHKVFAALDELFVKARQIQDWLEFCATEICRSIPLPMAERYGFNEADSDKFISDDNAFIGEARRKNSSTWNPCKDYGLKNDLEMTDRYPQTPVTWTTPLSFRVLQPYLKSSSVQLKTVLQLCSLQQSTIFDAIDSSKQIAAFPPNFIHSLDATHMFRTALACFKAEITFASVHDCFWTHAATVPQMNRILREEFVAMHNEPILERLRQEFLKLYNNYKVPCVIGHKKDGERRKVWRNIYIPPLPQRGEFDLKNVLKNKMPRQFIRLSLNPPTTSHMVYFDIIKTLVNCYGAKVNAINNDGYRAIGLAENDRIVSFLLKLSSKPKSKIQRKSKLSEK